jgi:RNA polymerase sigma factor for flagellar operon FliA
MAARRGEMTEPSGKDAVQAELRSKWERYTRTKSEELKRELILSHLGLVRYVVGKLGVPSGRTSLVLQESDLVQIGIIGLMEAIDRYDPGRGVKFESFAIARIKGSIQDELRKLDWVPRSVRKKIRGANQTIQQAEDRNGHGLSANEMADRLSMSVEEYGQLLTDAQSATIDFTRLPEEDTMMVENIAGDDTSDPSEVISNEEVKSQLVDSVEHLPQRERLVITLYYYEGLTFKEIARVLKLSDSRVFQIHASILKDLRQTLASVS